VILDVKRGDIGSTAAAYADAYFGPGAPLAADAITVSPYLGFGSLRPMIDSALSVGAGIFVLARTSNPEGGEVQLARRADGRSVAQAMIDEISQVNAGVRPLGDVGAVIGATTGGDGLELSTMGGPILAPGLGAQGARAADLGAVFGSALRDVLPVSAREILAHGPEPADLRPQSPARWTTFGGSCDRLCWNRGAATLPKVASAASFPGASNTCFISSHQSRDLRRPGAASVTESGTARCRLGEGGGDS
jgi:orotidine-5'-phosphate decarboxylase